MYQMIREPDGKIYFVYLSKSTESLIEKHPMKLFKIPPPA